MDSVKTLLLNLHVWCVLLDLVISFFGIPYLIFPAVAGYGLGIVDAPGLWIYLGVTLITGVSTSIFVIFENRYFILFGRTSWWRHVRKYAIATSYILVPLYFLPPQFVIPNQELSKPIALETLSCIPELPSDSRELYVLAITKPLVAICVAFAEGTPTIEVGTFLFLNCFYLIFQKPSGLSKKTVQMQNKLVIALIVQSSVTIVLFLAPVNGVVFFILLDHQNQMHNNLLVFALAIHGIASTVVMIFAHKPYRDFVFHPIARFYQSPPTIVVIPSVQSFRSVVEV